MNLVFLGHNEKYRVESLVKMFFPVARFQYLDWPVKEDEYLLLRQRTGKDRLHFLAVVRLAGRQTIRHGSVCKEMRLEERQYVLSSTLYAALCAHQQRSLPWGMLTGVRPVKRVHKMLQQGLSPQQAVARLETAYAVSTQRAELAVQTALVQDGLQLHWQPNEIGLYVSIPFCPTRCRYCSFVSQAVGSKRAEVMLQDYLPCLCRELEELSRIVRKHRLAVRMVYIGGGTPTTLDAGGLLTLLSAMQRLFDLSLLDEYTVETGRADTITPEKLELLRRFGVGRICINPQTFDDDLLRRLNRSHTAAEVLQAYDWARQVGFDTINMDLIAGLPGDSAAGFDRTLQQAVALAPENLTVHTLTLKRSSDLYAEHAQGNPAAAQMVANSQQVLLQAGYRPYYLYRQKNMIDNLENVGYAMPGSESPYNIAMMEENQTILAAGAGSVTKLVGHDGPKRLFNYKYPSEYIRGMDEVLHRKKMVDQFYETEKQH